MEVLPPPPPPLAQVPLGYLPVVLCLLLLQPVFQHPQGQVLQPPLVLDLFLDTPIVKLMESTQTLDWYKI